MKLDLNPGDLFDWVYKINNQPVHPNERIRSSLMNQWVPIGGPEPMLCIGIMDEMIAWLSAKGLFHARVDDTATPRDSAMRVSRLFHTRVDDTQGRGAYFSARSVVPRARG